MPRRFKRSWSQPPVAERRHVDLLLAALWKRRT
jgi:hypothetical protein